MAPRPPHTHVRPWRWLAAGLAMVVLAAGYWVALERIDTASGNDPDAPRHVQQGLDRHTPRVD